MVNTMLKILERHKKYLIFISIIILIGICSGIIYYNLLNSEIKENISYTMLNYNNFRYNNIIKDLIVMSLLLVTSIFIIGVPCGLFYLFYEGLSMGIIISIFNANFSISGLIYSILYIFINKILIIILMMFFLKKLINISRYIIGIIIYKKDLTIRNKLILSLNNCMYLIIIVLVINIILYFITPSIFNNLVFLLK